MVDLPDAYAACSRLARAHYENFPVASLLLPPAMRHHVAAVYAFARVADDFADEGGLEPGQRLRLLDGWESRLLAAAAGAPPQPAPQHGEPVVAPQIFLALGHTISTHALPVDLFQDLLSAFRQDVIVNRYETWVALMDYCRRSANPIGRLVLRIAGYGDPGLARLSDCICTALQLTNFWQDIAQDAERGRVYLPAEAHRGGVPMLDAVARTRALFMEGRPLCDAVGGRLAYELKATWLGGMRLLDRLESGAVRPRLSARDLAPIGWKMVTW